MHPVGEKAAESQRRCDLCCSKVRGAHRPLIVKTSHPFVLYRRYNIEITVFETIQAYCDSNIDFSVVLHKISEQIALALEGDSVRKVQLEEFQVN